MKKKWWDDSFWHHKFIDLWTIPHIIFGTIPAFIFSIFEKNMLFGFLLTVLVAIVWEVGETVVGVSYDEVLSNKISDVFIAGLGYGMVWAFIYTFNPTQELIINIFYVSLFLLIITSAIGWYGYYLWHRK